MRQWETPVLIPNTMVKTLAADGTLLETARESRWMPLYKNNHESVLYRGCIIHKGMQSTSSILVMQIGFNFLNPHKEHVPWKLHIENDKTSNRKETNLINTNTFFYYKNDRPIIVTLCDDVVMLQRAQGGCLGTESRRKTW